jgi:hypothetical protein
MYWSRTEAQLPGAPVEAPAWGRDVRRDVRIKVAINWQGPFRSAEDIRVHRADWAGCADVLYLVAGIDSNWRDDVRRNETLSFVGCRKADNVESATVHFDALKPGSAEVWIGTIAAPPDMPWVAEDAAGDEPDEQSCARSLRLIKRALVFALQPRHGAHLKGEMPDQRLRIDNTWPEQDKQGLFPDRIECFPEKGEMLLGWKAQEYAAGHRVVSHALPRGHAEENEQRRRAPLAWPALALVALIAAGAIGYLGVAHAPSGSFRVLGMNDVGTAGENFVVALRDMRERADAAAVALQQAGSQIRDLEGQLAQMTARLKLLETRTAPATDPGLELRSCWSRTSARTVSVYRLTITDDGFIVDPKWAGDGWPKEFSGVMSGFAQSPIAPHTEIARAAFHEAMMPYYEYGTSGTRNCRFFVDVVDGTTTKESWKSGLAMVEQYYYKRLVGGAAGKVATR